MKKICIDVGHSAKDGGAINKAYGVNEFMFNKEVAEYLQRELKQQGYDVCIVWRETYSKLPNQINDTGADICISLHANAYNEIASGTEVLYWHTSKNGKKLANNIQEELLDCLGLRDRGIKPLQSNSRGGSLLRKTIMPTVITEAFFIDNIVDFVVADNEKLGIAKAIVKGINTYFGRDTQLH